MARSLAAQRPLVARLNFGRQLLDRGHRLLESGGERRPALLAEGLLEPPRRNAERIEVRRPRQARLLLESLLEREGGFLGLLDSLGRLPLAQLCERRAQVGEIAATGGLLGHLAQRGERRCVAHYAPALHRCTEIVECEPRLLTGVGLVGTQVHAPAVERLGGEDADDAFAGRRELRSRDGDTVEIVAERHAGQHRLGFLAVSTRTQHARDLFAPLGRTYDRYARLLSFGQDPRWRAYLVSRIPADADRVLDVASGTAAVSIALARAQGSRTIVGVDQSAEMLAAGRNRVERAGLASRIELREGRAEALPFGDEEFDALTFTYLLRYVDDPAATMRELVRVVRPGGTVAMQEFGLPSGVWRPLWELYVRVGLPAAGAVVSPAWREVGSFLGPSIRGFYGRMPLTALLDLWRDAGVTDVRCKRMSVGGGIVVWGTRA